MLLTNKFQIPESFMNFADRDAYDSGDADLSVTSLIDSSRVRKLKNENEKLIEEDISQRIMSILGTAVHNILEVGCPDGATAEKRFFYETKSGKVITGQVDLIEENESGHTISDYKVVRGTAVSMNPNGKPEWVNQLNCYAWLAGKHGFNVTKLQIVAVVRDWSNAAAMRSSDYPQSPVVCIPIKLNSAEETESYIDKKIEDHFAEGLRECTPEERWKGSDIHAVYEYAKSGGLKSRAKRLFDSSFDAQAYMLDNNINGEVVLRESKPTRCEGDYCSVSKWCDQYQNEKGLF
jgi:hypothetical protein